MEEGTATDNLDLGHVTLFTTGQSHICICLRYAVLFPMSELATTMVVFLAIKQISLY